MSPYMDNINVLVNTIARAKQLTLDVLAIFESGGFY